MIISTLRKTPELSELFQVLKEDFSDRYSYDEFELGLEQSMIIKKSTFVGVQVTQRGNVITVDGTFPGVATSFLSAVISAMGIWVPSLLSSSWRNLENETVAFLRRKYT